MIDFEYMCSDCGALLTESACLIRNHGWVVGDDFACPQCEGGVVDLHCGSAIDRLTDLTLKLFKLEEKGSSKWLICKEMLDIQEYLKEVV